MSNIFISAIIVLAIVTHIRAGDYGPRCEANAVPKECGKLCEPTCEKPNEKWCPPECTDDCKTECRCEEGHVRHNGRCIKFSKCPKPPPKCSCDEEEFSLCGRLCEPTCTNPHPKYCPKTACTKHTQGCRCKKGLLRDPLTKKCIHPKECKQCGINEKLGPCGRNCEATCENPILGKCDLAKCKDFDCQCKKGFCRNKKTDKCVPEEECPKKCGYGEIYRECGRACEGTCKHPFEPKHCQQKKNLTPGCTCDLEAGYVRDEGSGKCIRIKECKKPCETDNDKGKHIEHKRPYDDDSKEKFKDIKIPHHDIGIEKLKHIKIPHHDIGIEKHKHIKIPHHDIGIEKLKHIKIPHHDIGIEKFKHIKIPHHDIGIEKLKGIKKPHHDIGIEKLKDIKIPHHDIGKEKLKHIKIPHHDIGIEKLKNIKIPHHDIGKEKLKGIKKIPHHDAGKKKCQKCKQPRYDDDDNGEYEEDHHHRNDDDYKKGEY